MVDELSSGPSLALEVRKKGTQNLVQAFRDLCGPADPSIARVLRPSTIRALFGEDRVRHGDVIVSN